MIGRALAADDFVSGLSHFGGSRGFVLRGPVCPLSQRDSADAGRGPEHDLGVAMFADDMGVNGTSDACMSGSRSRRWIQPSPCR